MRNLLLPIVASLVIHTVIAAPAYGPFFGKGKDPGAVFISYVEPAPAPFQKKEKIVRAHIPDKASRERSIFKKAAVRESAELLTDPQMGRVFHAYFVRLKEKIHQVIRRDSGEQPGSGSVALLFILRSDGTLDKVSVLDGGSSAGTAMRGFAVNCVKASAPFDPFPKELDPAKISFRITIRFSELTP